MPSVYTPNATNNPTSYTVPADGDNANVASVLTGLEAVMDKAAYIGTAVAATYKPLFVAVSNTVVTSGLTVGGVTVVNGTFPTSFNLLSTDLMMVHAVASLSSGTSAVNAQFKGGFVYSGGTSFVDAGFTQGANSSTAGFIGQNVPYLWTGTGLALTTVTAFTLAMAASATGVTVNQVRLIVAILRAG